MNAILRAINGLDACISVTPFTLAAIRSRRDVRVKIEASIERMLELLDAVDGDPDLEPYVASPHGDDREEDAGDAAENVRF